MLSFFPRDVLDEIWDLIEPISEGFPPYSYIVRFKFYVNFAILMYLIPFIEPFNVWLDKHVLLN